MGQQYFLKNSPILSLIKIGLSFLELFDACRGMDRVTLMDAVQGCEHA